MTDSENGPDVSHMHDFCGPMPLLFDVCHDINLIHQTLELDDLVIKGRDVGLSSDIVKDYVDTLTTDPSSKD